MSSALPLSRRTSTPRAGVASASPLRPTSPSQTTTAPSGSLTPSSPQPKPRAVDLLRKHYGLGVGPPPALPGKALDPMNLDSSAFDAKNYYEQLITTSSLPTLLKRENELLKEIRKLDSERQSLVYTHHHELIAASDTIAVMKTRAESLDADLESLRLAFSEISRIGAEVSLEKSERSYAGNQVD